MTASALARSRRETTVKKTPKQTREEALVRAAVRQAIKEGIDDARAEILKRRKNSMMTDVGGEDLRKIATELGFSVSGAKQAVDKALKKAQFLQKLEESDVELMVLTAVKDYVSDLEAAIDPEDPEAPTAEDIQLMYDHPDIVASLDNFRDYLHKYVKKMAKMSGERIS